MQFGWCNSGPSKRILFLWSHTKDRAAFPDTELPVLLKGRSTMDRVKLSGDVIIILKTFSWLRTLDLPLSYSTAAKWFGVSSMAGSLLGVRIFGIKEEQSLFLPRDQKHTWIIYLLPFYVAKPSAPQTATTFQFKASWDYGFAFRRYCLDADPDIV